MLLSRQKGDLAGQVKALRLLSLAYLAASDLASHHRVVDEGEPLARSLGDMNAECWFLREKFQRHWFAQQYKEANAVFDEAMALARRKHLDSCLALLYATKGLTASTVGRNSEGIEWLSKAYAMFQAAGDRYYMAKTLADIATVLNAPNTTQGDQEKSLAYLRQALTMMGPSYRRSSYEYNLRIGRIYLGNKNFAEAERYFREALVIANRIGSPPLVATINFHFGEVFQQQHRLADALRYFDIALPPASHSPDKALLIRCLLKRAEVLAQLGRNTDSLHALASGQAAMPQPPSPILDALYHDSAAKVYMQLGQYREAYQEVNLLREAEKQLATAANERLASELEVRFDVQRKETENALLRAQQREAETRRLALALALALSVLLLGGLALYLRKHAADAQLEAEHQRTIARAEAAANQAKDAFLANMSHELRSPLNAILGFARLMSRNTTLPANLAGDLGIIVKSGEHLYTLINQVLDLSKVKAGHATLSESDFRLYELLDELTGMFTLAAEQKNLRLIVDNHSDVPRYIRTDAMKLRQILINLLGNAVKFTKKGEVVLQVSRKRNGKPDRCRLVFSVSDTGPGIAPEELRRLGQAFVQAQEGLQAREGTGLGLALSRGFAEILKGELHLSSELGKGTIARLDIPVEIVNEASIAADIPHHQQRAVSLAPNQPRYRILAVDDQEEGRKLLVRLLTPMGFDVREASNGQEAISIWEEWNPHLIWMDMRMPLLDGRTATRRIKATEKGKSTIIIALTASSFEVERETILADGCDDFLRKPYHESALFELMHKHLGVNFIYEESTDEKDVALPSAANLGKLPAALRMQLEQALKRLDVPAIDAAIEAIGHHDIALSQTLAGMARDFQYSRMLECLSPPPPPDKTEMQENIENA